MSDQKRTVGVGLTGAELESLLLVLREIGPEATLPEIMEAYTEVTGDTVGQTACSRYRERVWGDRDARATLREERVAAREERVAAREEHQGEGDQGGEDDEDRARSDSSGADDLAPGREYVYHGDLDEYIVMSDRFERGVLRVPGVLHRDIIRKYSNLGEGARINQLCAYLSWPRRTVIEYLRIFGHTHDRGPWSSEELRDGDPDQLVASALEARRGYLENRLVERVRTEERRDALRWRRAEKFLIEGFAAALGPLPPVPAPPSRAEGPPGPFGWVICPTDIHLGLLSTEADTGARYDTPTAFEETLATVRSSLERSLRMTGPPERIYLALGSDLINADNLDGTTTNGTKQDMDSTATELLVYAERLESQLIQLCRSYALEVHVPMMLGGNHARVLEFALARVTAARFEKTPDVTIYADHARARRYLRWENTLMGWTHGDRIKGPQLVRCMAEEARPEWGSCDHRIWWAGHVHHDVEDSDGCTVYRLWPMCRPSRWTNHMGYVSGQRGIAVHFIDPQEGVIGGARTPAPEPNQGETP